MSLEICSETFNLHYLRMDDQKWEALGCVYQQLPEFKGYVEGIPWWFGIDLEWGWRCDDNQEPKPHLWASVEPSGLLVEGILEAHDWARWQEVFVSLATAALGFQVKPADEDNEEPYA